MSEPLRVEISMLVPGEWRVVERSHRAAENIFRVLFAEAELAELLAEINHCLIDANASLETQRAHLRRLAGRLAELSLPAVLRDKIAAWKEPVEFFVDDAALRLPVELFPNGETVLAEAVPVSRHWFCEYLVPPRRESGTMGRQALVVADPADNLPGAQVEGETVFRLMRAIGGGWNCRFLGRKVTLAEVSREVLDTNVLHLAAHYTSAETGVEGGVVMADGLWLPSWLSLAPALVFANCCRAGLATSGDNGLSLAGRFLKQGSRHVVAPFLPASDHAAMLFAEQFYRSLAQGMEVSEAVWEARKSVGPPGWMYWHFGPAEENRESGKGQTVRKAGVLYPVLFLLAVIVAYLFFNASSTKHENAPQQSNSSMSDMADTPADASFVERKSGSNAITVMGKNPPDDF